MKLKISQYAKMQKVTYRTVWNWIKAGKLVTERTETGRVLIVFDENKELNVAVYARVSSSEDKINLETQKDRLISYCNAKGYKVAKVVTEIGSGLNDKRVKLEGILTDPSINLIVVEHKDRLARFGVNYIEKLLEMQNRKLEIINPIAEERDDLIQDFISIITSFCARIYGQRRSKRNTEKLIKELSNDSNQQA